MEEMKELNIEEIHNVSLSALKKIIEICDHLNINYYMTYGTLIGVIRHKGFIPWDDDLDITMLRKDFNVFCEYCYSHEKELYPYKLLSIKNTENYPYGIPRFNDMRFTAVYGNVKAYDSGIFIDIYPLDGADHLADFPDKVHKLERKKTFLLKCLALSVDTHYIKSKNNSIFSEVIKRFMRCVCKKIGNAYFINKLSNLSNLYTLDESEYVSLMTWDPDLPLFKKEWFKDYLYADFEDIRVKIPVGYDEFLKLQYGNYMELPPVEQRIPSHDYKIYKK